MPRPAHTCCSPRRDTLWTRCTRRYSDGRAGSRHCSCWPPSLRPASSASVPTSSTPKRTTTATAKRTATATAQQRSEEHTSELQSRGHLVCRLLLEKKNKQT